LITNAGQGISHAIGTGGRDLADEVGGLTTLMALDLLDRDPSTRQIVLVSKPTTPHVAKVVLARARESAKPITICIIGNTFEEALPPNVTVARTLAEAAEVVLGHKLAPYEGPVPERGHGRLIRGLFSGGTLCSEAQLIALKEGQAVASNAPVPGAALLGVNSNEHEFIDLGSDEFTRGRPHPMIEPAIRNVPLMQALADKTVGVVLLDVILGWGSHADPAGEVARAIASRPVSGPMIVASVTGTESDPQVRSTQVSKLVSAGVVVAPSNAAATTVALSCVQQ
jgi:hypothetical protein